MTKNRSETKPCATACEIFTAASALSAFLITHCSQEELNTLINLLNLISANLSAAVTQQEICAGNVVQPTI